MLPQKVLNVRILIRSNTRSGSNIQHFAELNPLILFSMTYDDTTNLFVSLDQECYNTSKLASENPPTTAPITQGATSTVLTKESTIGILLISAGTKHRLPKQKRPNEIDEKM